MDYHHQMSKNFWAFILLALVVVVGLVWWLAVSRPDLDDTDNGNITENELIKKLDELAGMATNTPPINEQIKKLDELAKKATNTPSVDEQIKILDSLKK